MNKSMKNRIWGWVLLFSLMILLLSIPHVYKIILTVMWSFFLLYYLYPGFFTFIAFASHNGRGKERYLKIMSFAYNSGRVHPKSAATFSYVLLREGNLERASQVLDYAEERAEERKSWRKGLVQYNHVHSYRALILWKQNKLDEAAELLQNLHNQDYRTSTLYANLGWFLLKQGKYDEALLINREALEYDRSAAILDNIGLNYLKLGELDKCRDIYAELLDLDPAFPDAWYNYGQLLQVDGKEEKAQEMFQKALSCDFSFLGTVTKEEVEQYIK